MLVQHSTIKALRWLSWYSGVLKEIWGCCAGSEEYHGSSAEAVLVQQSTIGLLGRLCGYTRVLKEQNTIGTLERPFRAECTIKELRRLCWYSRVLQEQLECCTGGAEYYKSTLDAVLVQQRIIGAHERLCWYSRVL